MLQCSTITEHPPKMGIISTMAVTHVGSCYGRFPKIKKKPSHQQLHVRWSARSLFISMKISFKFSDVFHGLLIQLFLGWHCHPMAVKFTTPTWPITALILQGITTSTRNICLWQASSLSPSTWYLSDSIGACWKQLSLNSGKLGDDSVQLIQKNRPITK